MDKNQRNNNDFLLQTAIREKMHLDKQTPALTVSDAKRAENMEQIDTDGLRNGVSGSTVNGTDLQDPPAEVTGIIHDPEDEFENAAFDESRQFNEHASFDTAVVDESMTAENFETTEAGNGLEGANSEDELPAPPPAITGVISDPEDGIPAGGDTPPREDGVVPDEIRQSRSDDVEQDDPESGAPPSGYIFDEADPESETASARGVRDTTGYAVGTGFENGAEPRDPEAIGVIEEGSLENEDSPDELRNSIPIEVVATESGMSNQGDASDADDERATPTTTTTTPERLNAQPELDYDNNRVTGYIDEVDKGEEGATSQPKVEWQISEYEQSPKDGGEMQLAENGALQSMSDPAPTSERKPFADPEDPEFWFKAKSPINMDCYFAFACLSCIVNLILGSIALYLVQKGRDSSTANEARKYGCYSAGVGALGILITVAIIALIIVFA